MEASHWNGAPLRPPHPNLSRMPYVRHSPRRHHSTELSINTLRQVKTLQKHNLPAVISPPPTQEAPLAVQEPPPVKQELPPLSTPCILVLRNSLDVEPTEGIARTTTAEGGVDQASVQLQPNSWLRLAARHDGSAVHYVLGRGHGGATPHALVVAALAALPAESVAELELHSTADALLHDLSPELFLVNPPPQPLHQVLRSQI